MHRFVKLAISLLIGFVVMIGVTQALASSIAFSLMIGIPSGVIVAMFVYIAWMSRN